MLTLLAIGLTASEKLDRTYLPPPGAAFAGGNPQDILAPLLPNFQQPGTIPIGPALKGHQDFGQITTPVTTTSYAFSQTTTYPPVENYETTALPINPVTGTPIQSSGQQFFQQYDQNLPGTQGTLTPGYYAPVGFNPQISIAGQPINMATPDYSQSNNKGRTQYPDNNITNPGSISQGPSSNQGLIQYPGQDNQVSYQYPNANSVVPGEVIQIPGLQTLTPGVNQGSVQYPEGQSTLLPSSIPANVVPQGNVINIQPGNQYPQFVPQDTHSQQLGPHVVQPTNAQYGRQQFTQEYPNQDQFNPNITPAPTFGNQPTPDYNAVSSTTSVPSFPSTLSPFATIPPINRPERPQAASDRNAVILNYENIHTPNGYSYSFDTSNGIHVDETGKVGDGTRAQGSYSYIGDDGKIYSVTYTADENGFQPHGDHLPTPPPIPEAIKKVIEQAAKDREAGIVDDGSYDELKYGDIKYQSPMRSQRPQKQRISNNNSRQGTLNEIQPIIEPVDDGSIGSGDDAFGGGDTSTYNDDFTSNYDVPHNFPVKNIGISENDITEPFAGLNVDQKAHVAAVGSSGHPHDTNVASTGLHDENQNSDYSHDNTSDSPIRGPFTKNGQQFSKTQNPGSQADYVDNIYPENQNTFESNFNENNNLNSGDSNPEYLTPGQGSSKVSVPNTSTINNYAGNGPQESGSPNNNNYNDRLITGPLQTITDQSNANLQPHQSFTQQDKNGYYYNPPQPQTTQAQFPNRFKVPELRSGTDSVNPSGTTRRPFTTPEVYNQKPQNRQSNNRQSTTLRPFMASRVTTENKAYTEYDDGDDYATDDEGTHSTSAPVKTIDNVTRRPHRPLFTTSRPYTPSGTRTHVKQSGTVTPHHKVNYSNTPSNDQVSTTTPNSRFGGVTNARQNKPQPQRRPANGFRRPAISNNTDKSQSPTPGTPEYKYQDNSLTAGTPQIDHESGYGSRIPSGQKGSLQNYPSSGYNTITTTAPTTAYQYQPNTQEPNVRYQSRYQNNPTQTEYTTTVRPQTPFSSNPNYYQTTYGQGPLNNLGMQSTPGRPGTFVLTGPGASVANALPNLMNMAGFQYGHAEPGFSSSRSSNLGPYASPSPSTIGTTPVSFISSTTGLPTQSYTSTQRPSTPGTFVQSPLVDGFGRTIVSGQQPDFTYPGQATTPYPGQGIVPGGDITGSALPAGFAPRANVTPSYNSQPSSPVYFDQGKVIGEDFTGPKQPQRFDPQTGYHY